LANSLICQTNYAKRLGMLLHEEEIYLMEFSFMKVIDCMATPYTPVASNHKVHLLLRGSLSHGRFHLAHLLVVVAAVDTRMFMTS
jgi:hypothetical protein